MLITIIEDVKRQNCSYGVEVFENVQCDECPHYDACLDALARELAIKMKEE